MRALALAMLSSCALHGGVAPATTRYAAVDVGGMVAEPGLGDEVGGAVRGALTAVGAWDPANGAPVSVEVLSADMEPWRRGESGLMYRARLVVFVHTGALSRTFSVEREVADPAGAAAAVDVRAAVFRDLAEQAAQRAAAWLASAPAAG